MNIKIMFISLKLDKASWNLDSILLLILFMLSTVWNSFEALQRKKSIISKLLGKYGNEISNHS